MKDSKTYRINGFEQIKAFYSWVFNNPDKAHPTHISLYLFLINQSNRANWVEWFKCPYDLAMQGACIGNNGTYYRCLDDLQKWNLIKYKKGINNYKAPLVHLICLYDSEQLTEQVTVPLSEQLTEQLTEQLPVHIYNVLTNNLKRITDNIEEIINFLDSKDKPKTFDFKSSFLSLGVEESIISDWLKVRKSKKGTNTETSFKAIKKQIELSGASANDCIKKAVEKSWCGFEAEWYKNSTPLKNIPYKAEKEVSINDI